MKFINLILLKPLQRNFLSKTSMTQILRRSSTKQQVNISTVSSSKRGLHSTGINESNTEAGASPEEISAAEKEKFGVNNNTHPDFMPSSSIAPKAAMENYELNEEDGESLEDLEEMFIEGPAGVEWGGPTRGGRRPEPTRYGDWERKGRTSDF